MLGRGRRRVFVTQVTLTLFTVIAFTLIQGWAQGIAAAFGGAVNIVSTLWMGGFIRRLGEPTSGRPGRGKRTLYIGAVQRLAMVTAAFALGLGALRLAPLPLLATFVVAQIGYVLAASRC